MKLYDHQRRAVELARTKPRFAFFWEMGCGKTITLLSVCAERPMKTLVLCPRSVMNAAWAADAKMFPDLKTVCLWHDNKAKRRALVEGEWDIGISNFENAKTIYRELMASGFARLIVDESSRIKKHDTDVTKMVLSMAAQAKECYLLAGTPAPNHNAEYWAQMRCVDPKWVNPSFWTWACRYFVPIKRKRPGGPEYTATWVDRPDTKAEFVENMRRLSWALTKSECLDLPSKIDKIVTVELGAEERSAYRSVEKELRILESRVKSEAVLIKARQITGGSVLVDSVPTVLGSSKLKALADVIEEAGSQPIVVWAEFTHEIDRIADTLGGYGKTAIIDGRSSSRAGEIVADFQSGKTKYLVCHPAAAGHGITLTAASIAVYYSLSFSSELHLQSRDRIHRIGQTRHCVYVYLIADDTVDWPMFRSLRGKKTRADAITDALREVGSLGGIPRSSK